MMDTVQNTGCQGYLYFNKEGNTKPKECMSNCGISDHKGKLGASKVASPLHLKEKIPRQRFPALLLPTHRRTGLYSSTG